MQRPKLRGLDLVPVQVQGTTWIRVHDPEGLASEDIVVNVPTAVLASLMNGERTVEQIVREFALQTGGILVRHAEVEQLVRRLDELGFLEGERAEQRVAELDRQYAMASERPPALAGKVYEADADALRRQISGFYGRDGAAPWPEHPPVGRVAGVISPHIDFGRGGFCYTHAFAPLVRARAGTYVILGVAHAPSPAPFLVTDKAFTTPLGRAAPAREILAQLRRRAPAEAFERPRLHQTEHSVELPLVFLQHAVGRPIQIVPILCGSPEAIVGDGSPRSSARIENFLGALREATTPWGDEVVFVSGADLAHIGPRFGDDRPITPDFVRWMEEQDMRSLAQVQLGDAEGFYASVVADGNRRKVCGLGSIYALLRMVEGRRGDVRRYGFAPDPAGGVVSFAAAVFA